MAGFDVVVEGGERVLFFVVGVETGDFGSLKEVGELVFEEFGAKTFVDNLWMVAGRAVFGDLLGMAAGVADELIRVCVQREG